MPGRSSRCLRSTVQLRVGRPCGPKYRHLASPPFPPQVHVAREFLRAMAQPYDRGAVGKSLLSEAALEALEAAGGLEGAGAAGA